MMEIEKHDSGTEKLINGHEEHEPTPIIRELWPEVKLVYLDSSQPIDFPTKLVVILCNILKKSTLNETINIWKNYVKHFEKLGCKVSFSLPFTCKQISCIEEIDENNDTEKLYVNCAINKSIFATNRESYSLLLSNKTQLLARDKLGLHRAIQTLAQIYSNKDVPGTKLQAFTIHDSPSFCYRALKIDLSLISLKIMKKETLHHLIEGISLLKFNQLHLVCSVDPMTGAESWPMSLSSMEIVELDIFCSQWGISLVPELEASESSNESDLEVLRCVYSKFLQCFSQPKYVSLGPQITKLLTKNKAIPLDIEMWIKYIPVTLNHTTLLLNTTENLNLLEKDQMRTILVFNDVTSAQTNQIQRNIISINCSSHESIGGCMKKFIPQVKKLISDAWQDSCTLGVIINLATENFFLPLSLCLPGIIAIAGFAWNANALNKSSNEENEIERIIGSVLNRIILQDNDEIIGKTILDLARVEADLVINDIKRKDTINEVSLVYLLLTNPDACEFDRTSALSFQKGIRSICQVQVSLHRSQISCSQSGEIQSELLLVGDLMLLACRLGKSLVSAGANPDSTLGCDVINAGIANLPSTARTDIANRLLGLMDQFRAVWLSRYCPNNLPASMLLLQELLNKLVPEDFAKEA